MTRATDTRTLPVWLALVATIAAVICVLDPLPPAVRAPWACALALWLPGRALTGALFRRPPGRAGATTLVAVGLSLATAVIAAVELAAFGELRQGTWAPLLAGVTLVAATVMRARDHRPPRVTVRAADVRRPVVLAAAVLVPVMLAGSLMVARRPMAAPADRGYTTLAVVAATASPDTVTVEVQSHEATRTQAVLRATMRGGPPRLELLRLAPGDVVRRNFFVPPGSRGLVTVELTPVAGSKPISRRVNIRVPTAFP